MSAKPGFHRLGILVVIAALFVSACAPPAQPTATPPAEGVTVIDPPILPGDFTLTSQAAQPFHFSDLKGKLTLLTFGYTHCPDVCPVTLAHFKQVRQALGEDAAGVNFVFVSVDGARDTPERLTEYLKLFDPTFIGLTGEEATVREVITRYGGRFILNNAGGLRKDYTVEHSAGSYLLDQQSQWRRRYAYATAPEIIAADIRQVLKG